jgi:hypothetical protein
MRWWLIRIEPEKRVRSFVSSLLEVFCGCSYGDHGLSWILTTCLLEMPPVLRTWLWLELHANGALPLLKVCRRCRYRPSYDTIYIYIYLSINLSIYIYIYRKRPFCRSAVRIATHRCVLDKNKCLEPILGILLVMVGNPDDLSMQQNYPDGHLQQ